MPSIRLVATISLVLASWVAVATADDGPADFSLPNRLRVRMVPVEGSKEVAILLGVRGGFFDEPPGIPHLAHVAEHLIVFASPPDSDEGKAASRWFGAGKANAETLPGWMYFDLRVGREELDAALRVQAARLSRPEFSEVILAREVPRALAEVEFLEKSEMAGTGKFAFSAFAQAADHGRTEVPIKAGTRTITVEDVRRFHARTFRPDRAMLVVVGGFDADQASRSIRDLFGKISQPPGQPARTPVGGVENPPTARWDASTRHLILGWRTPPEDDPEHAALALAATALQRRLMLDRELTMLARSPIVTDEVEGLFLANVQVRPGADLAAVEAGLMGHVRRLGRPEGLGDAEF